jgi:seryl-tRNA synthetase
MLAQQKGRVVMAKKDKITQVSERIGKALGKADKQAHIHARKLSAASKVTKEELQAISKQVDALKKQLAKTTLRLKKVLTT